MLPACGADVVSKGELFRALLAGVDPQKIVYAGVGKRYDEIRYALENRILMLNVESAQELQAIEAIATEMQVTAGVGIRVNPNIKVALTYSVYMCIWGRRLRRLNPSVC